ncbi:MAG: hypothetical protein Q7R31_01235 [Candidatus Levybacteria bacterium]|nr:hypothetical protein [Candidatus Levybacteria bacterium]
MDTMQNTDYKKVLTEVIQKQMIILGPTITLAKARNVQGLTVADDGTITEISGSPQVLIQSLIDQFVQLSGLIVKKTMEPLLANFPDGVPDVPVVSPETQSVPPAPPLQPQQPTPPPQINPDMPSVNPGSQT